MDLEGRAYDGSRIREIPCQPFRTSILHSQRSIKKWQRQPWKKDCTLQIDQLDHDFEFRLMLPPDNYGTGTSIPH